MNDATDWMGFFVKPSGEVEELAPDGESAGYWTEDPSFYDTLVLAGYPLSGGGIDDSWIDLSVAPSRMDAVTVYTEGPGEHEHDMGPASALFLRWYESVSA